MFLTEARSLRAGAKGAVLQVNAGMPFRVLGEHVATEDGCRVVFMNVVGPLIIPIVFVVALSLAFASRSFLPLLLVLVIPLTATSATWIFRYRGPTVERRVTLFGFALLKKTYPLRDGDSASIEAIEDSILLTVRPRWAKLTLWSSALGKDLVVMRSNDMDELERAVQVLNDAIRKIRTRMETSAGV